MIDGGIEGGDGYIDRAWFHGRLRSPYPKQLRLLSQPAHRRFALTCSLPLLDLHQHPQLLRLLLRPHLLHKSILPRLPINALIRQEFQLPRRPHVADVLTVPLREDDVDFFEGATGRFGVSEVDDGEEAGVDDGEEEVGAPVDVGDHDWGDHDDDWIRGLVFVRAGMGFGGRLGSKKKSVLTEVEEPV